MKNYRIAVVPGDGIGLEIVPIGLNVLKVAAKKNGFSLETDFFDWGAGYYLKNNQFIMYLNQNSDNDSPTL